MPVSVRVMVCGWLDVLTPWLPKLTLAGERLTMEAVPVPVTGTVWGLLAALSVMVIPAFSVEANVGLNVTLIVQEPPLAATEPPV